MKINYKVWVVLFFIIGLIFVIWSNRTPKNLLGTSSTAPTKTIVSSLREAGAEAALEIKVKEQSFASEEEHQKVNPWKRQAENKYSTASEEEYQKVNPSKKQAENKYSTINPAEYNKSIFDTKCPHCSEVASLVIGMMRESCHIDVTSELMVNTVSSNRMYTFLLAIKDVGGSELFERVVYSAQNSVNCEDDASWIEQTKLLIDNRSLSSEN